MAALHPQPKHHRASDVLGPASQRVHGLRENVIKGRQMAYQEANPYSGRL